MRAASSCCLLLVLLLVLLHLLLHLQLLLMLLELQDTQLLKKFIRLLLVCVQVGMDDLHKVVMLLVLERPLLLEVLRIMELHFGQMLVQIVSKPVRCAAHTRAIHVNLVTQGPALNLGRGT